MPEISGPSGKHEVVISRIQSSSVTESYGRKLFLMRLTPLEIYHLLIYKKASISHTCSIPQAAFHHFIKTPQSSTMKYSFVLAGLAASAIATPFVDIVVGEDAVTTSSRRDHRQHGNRGWFSSLLGSSRSDSDSRHHKDVCSARITNDHIH